MSVVIETTLGDITVDLFINDRPRACLNFLKLCKIKYYNYNLFHTISRSFIAQTGDPSGSRTGGESIYGVLDGSEKRFFEGENEPRIKHTKMGLISFVGNDDHMIGSQFFFTLGEDLTYLDEKHCVFGEVVEGFDILEGINEVICDNDDRPYQDVRITHTVILDDSFPDPKKLVVPSRSPSPSAERLKGGRIAPDEEINEMEGKTQAEVVEMQAEREAKARATILEMVGDLPDADMAPPENVLFVCKLNPVTSDDDLEIIFSRFGKIKSCEVIRDKKTGDSLQYAFVEFEDNTACENAYFKMDNVLIDDRRIHVDFSQSVSKVKWRGKGRGVTHYDEKGRKSKHADSDIGKGNYKHKKSYENSEKRSNKMREKSRSPSSNKRSLTPKRNRSKNEYSRNSKHDDNRSHSRPEKSASTERRRKYSRSPTPNRDTYKSNREKYIPTLRQKKYSPLPPRRNKDSRESSSSARYRKRSASPKRKRDSSLVSKRDRNNTPDRKRRSRSSTPRKDGGKRNGNYEKSDRYNKNASTSSRKSAAEKKLYNKRRSVSSSKEGSDSDSDSKSKHKSERHTSIKSQSKISSTGKKDRESPERKKSDKDDKKKEKKRKKRKNSSSSEESDSDSSRELKKKATRESESSDSDYKKRKSKKKKSKKSKHNNSSSDNDYKKKTKKKKKYESDSG